MNHQVTKFFIYGDSFFIAVNQSNAAVINVACTENDLVTAITTAEGNGVADVLE